MDAKRNVLICEDDSLQLLILTAALGQAGYRTLSARTPAAAVREAARCGVDAVVADVQLDGGSAFDVVGGLRRLGLDAPVIMASAFTTPVLREKAREAGVSRFIEKPYPIPEILQSVNRAVRERSDRPRSRILVVEDHGPMRNTVSGILDDGGYEPLLAESGDRALEVLQAARKAIDLVIMDVSVPGPSGAALVKRILEIDPGLTVAMVTGDASREEIRSAYEAGAASLLRRPFGEAGLLAFVKGSLAIARKRRAAQEAEARKASAPWYRRWFDKFVHSPARGATLLVGSAVLTGVLGAAACSPGEPRRDESQQVLRDMAEQMHRFNQGYQQELKWYGINPR